MKWLATRAVSVAFTVLLLVPLVFLIQPQVNSAIIPVSGNFAVQPNDATPTTELTYPACTPYLYYIVSDTFKIHFDAFGLNKQSYRPGDSVAFTGTVTVRELRVYVNCYGQSYDDQKDVSPAGSNVKVNILDQTFQTTLTGSGSFSGSIVLPFTLSAGTYTATATASYHGSTDTKTAPLTVESYNPTLALTYPTLQAQVYPGQVIMLEGDGWIPNAPLIVEVDDTFNVTTDSSGHFAVQIPIPQDNPLTEDTHNIIVEQANLNVSTTFVVQYRTLLLSLSAVSSVTQGDTLMFSGNVTATETHEAVPGANVTLTLMGHSYTFRTNTKGVFQGQIPIDTTAKPGTYALSGNATRRGFKTSTLITQSLKILPALNVPVVASAVVVGSAAGAALSLRPKKVPKVKGKLSSSVQQGATPSVSPGTTAAQPAMKPGVGQTVPKVGPGQHPSIGPGHKAATGVGAKVIRAGPVPIPRATEFCIHCGMEIPRNSAICPECSLKLRWT